MKTYGEVDVEIYIFLTSALVRDNFIPGERATGIHWIGGSVGPGAGLDDVENILDAIGSRTLTPLSSSH
jgi:hypothetical protein